MFDFKSFFKISLPQKIDLLLILRGFLAYSVLVWHFKGYQYPIPELAFLTIPGRMAVWLFFILSGYLIGFGFSSRRYTYDKKGILDYYRNRILRIIPLFLTVSFVGWLTIETKPEFSLQFIIEQVLMLQWNHQYDLNGVFWTLGIEMQFYILAPLLCYLQFRNGFSLKKSLGFYILFLALPILAHEVFQTTWDIRALYANLAIFQVGIIGSQLFSKNWLTKINNQRIIFISLATAILILSGNLLYYKKAGAFISPVGMVLASFIGLLFILIHRYLESLNIKQNNWTKFLSVFGVLSYGIYAWHTFIFAYFKTEFFIFGTIQTFIFTIVSYYLVEKYLLSLKAQR